MSAKIIPFPKRRGTAPSPPIADSLCGDLFARLDDLHRRQYGPEPEPDPRSLTIDEFMEEQVALILEDRQRSRALAARLADAVNTAPKKPGAKRKTSPKLLPDDALAQLETLRKKAADEMRRARAAQRADNPMQATRERYQLAREATAIPGATQATVDCALHLYDEGHSLDYIKRGAQFHAASERLLAKGRGDD